MKPRPTHRVLVIKKLWTSLTADAVLDTAFYRADCIRYATISRISSTVCTRPAGIGDTSC
jgi:hypothetical protein